MVQELSKGLTLMSEHKVVLSISCGKCGAISTFEILISREDIFDSHLECENCGWNLLKFVIETIVPEFKE
jgi:DNA-directed RNA polymerase subunit RPC12/RpoP